MALALYRKYRPATFAEVVGQEHVTEPLSTALSAGRINHAYLFSGPRGCGKTSSARILARSLNCVQGPTPTPCGECNSCVALAPGGPGNIDVTELDAASHGGVDDTRELRDRAFFAPAESRYRVFIVDEAHMITTQGFNALLKIVEEPPEHLVFVFATTEPDKVLTTIRSRTHHYPFRLIPPGTLRGLLERICAEEGAVVAPPVFPLVLRAGGGSARDTLSVLDQLVAGAGPEGVTYERAVALLGVTDVALIDDVVDALAAGDRAAVFETVDRLAEAGHDPRRFASDLLQRFRDITLLQAVPDAADQGLVEAADDEIARIAQQAEVLGPATLARYGEILHTGLTEMRGATAPRLLLELLCARMLLPAVQPTESGLLERLERLERRGAIAPAPATAVEGATPAPSLPGPGDPADPDPAQSGEPGRRMFRRPSDRAPASQAAPAGSAEAPARPGEATARPAEAPARSAEAPARSAAPPASVDARPADAAEPPVVAGPSAEDPGTQRPGTAGPDPGQAVSDRMSARADAADPGSGAPAERPGAAGGDPGQAVSDRLAATDPGADVSNRLAARGIGGTGDAAPGRPPRGDDHRDGRGPAADRDGRGPAADRDGRGPAADRDGRGPAADRDGRGPAGADRQEAPAAEAPRPDPASLDAAAVRRVWPEILSAARGKSRSIEAMLVNATVRAVEGDTLVLGIGAPSLARRLSEPRNADIVSAALHTVLGVQWQVRCDSGEGGTPPSAPPRGGPPPEPQQPRRPQRQVPPRPARQKPAPEEGEPLPPEPPPDDAPPDYDDEAEMIADAAAGPSAEPQEEVRPRDPREKAIELLTTHLGARTIERR